MTLLFSIQTTQHACTAIVVHQPQMLPLSSTPVTLPLLIRPTQVLFLVPMRNVAYKLIMRLGHLAAVEGKGGMPGKVRFAREYGPGADPEALRAAAAEAVGKGRPATHGALFLGNTDDLFCLGVRLGRASARLFAELAESDILVASPLSLATAAAENKVAVLDQLSSINLVVLDRADVALMQNWEHVRSALAALNRPPKAQLTTDILRLRPWAADGLAACYRQTVVLSSFLAPEMLALARRHASSHAGALRLQTRSAQGVLPRVVPQMRQVFERLPRCAPAEEADIRFARFQTVLWPRIRDAARQGGQLIYVPSYFDFVRRVLKGVV